MRYFRFIYDITIIVIIILGIIRLINSEYYLAFTWIILVPIFMLLPRTLYKIKDIKSNYNGSIIDFFEILIFILLITSLGYTLGLKNFNIDFDSFSHLLNLAIYAIIVGVIYYLLKSRNHKDVDKSQVMLFTFIVCLIFGVILWERFQYFNDKVFGTLMFYDKFQDIELDSYLDQVFGSIGVIIGSNVLHNKLEDWIRKWKK